MDAFYMHGSIFREKGGRMVCIYVRMCDPLVMRDQGRARDTGVATGEYIPDADETD